MNTIPVVSDRPAEGMSVAKMVADRSRRVAAQPLLLLVLVVGVPAWLVLARAVSHARSAQHSHPATAGHVTDHLKLWTSAHSLVGAVIMACCTWVVISRVRSAAHERDVWRWWTAALAVLTAGFVIDSALPMAPSTQVSDIHRHGLAFGFCSLLACIAVYQGLMRWNRLRTSRSDVGDWLNGIGSVFAMVGLGNLILRWTDSPLREWPWWQVQGWLFRVAVVLVLAGSAITVALLGDLVRDLRAWVIFGALLVILACEVASVFQGEPTFSGWVSQLGWLFGAIAIAASAIRTPEARAPLAATMESTTAGVLIVLTVSAIVLVLDNSTDHAARLPAVYAVLAFLCAAFQGAHIIRALSHLAETRLEARSDELTGTANRRELLAQLRALITNGADVALLEIDLDRFKAINDRFGHATGDELLRLASDRLQNLMPPGALLARLGGDEFAVLLVEMTTSDAAELAARLIEALSTTFAIDGQRMTVGASIGVASLPGPTVATSDDDEAEDLLRRADVAMYLAKRAGGGVSTYDVSVDTEAREQNLLLEELRATFAVGAPTELRQQIVVHYQPQIDVVGGHIVGVEALVRWQHPRLGLLAPAAFLDLAEVHGLIGELTAHVLHEATTQAVNWRIAGHPVRMSVNLSPSFLTSTEIVPLIDRILYLTPLDPAALTLEITETGMMSDPEMALQTTRAIAARGIAISIDDFGTGYSSLSYLNDLPATELKLDRSFTSRLATDERTSAIVAGTIQLAHHLGLRVIAEGVEDQAALNVLRILDCDEAQGYLCGRPMPAAELEVWFRTEGHSPSENRVYL